MNFFELIMILLGGFVPSVLWLWFWLKEDRLHPEPRRILALTFLGGMIAVVFAFILEQITYYFFKYANLLGFLDGFLILFIWAFFEEISKYLAAKKFALSRKEFDEPVDALIYLITAALGFAALENIGFLTPVLTERGFNPFLVTGVFRFFGPTLIHILSSSIVGASIAFWFFHKSRYGWNLFFGIFAAVLLHAFFNYLIIKNINLGIFYTFLPFWVLIIALLYVFEKVKSIKTF